MRSWHTLASAAALLHGVSAHYRFIALNANNTITTDWEYVRQDTNSNSPVTDVTSDDIRCNVGSLSYGAETAIATVAAGSTVGAHWDVAPYHPGPGMAYLSKATGDITTYAGDGDWFKIWQDGPTFTSSAINFATGDGSMPDFNFTIPAATPPGDYLLRVEQVGLHVASSEGGAQFYISCAQLHITGSGSGTPSPTVKFPGAYSADDPGLLINSKSGAFESCQKRDAYKPISLLANSDLIHYAWACGLVWLRVYNGFESSKVLWNVALRGIYSVLLRHLRAATVIRLAIVMTILNQIERGIKPQDSTRTMLNGHRSEP
jgi:hypothetical protein